MPRFGQPTLVKQVRLRARHLLLREVEGNKVEGMRPPPASPRSRPAPSRSGRGYTSSQKAGSSKLGGRRRPWPGGRRPVQFSKSSGRRYDGRFQPLVRPFARLVESNEPLINLHEPLVNLDEPLVEPNERLVRFDEPLVEPFETLATLTSLSSNPSRLSSALTSLSSTLTRRSSNLSSLSSSSTSRSSDLSRPSLSLTRSSSNPSSLSLRPSNDKKRGACRTARPPRCCDYSGAGRGFSGLRGRARRGCIPNSASFSFRLP